MIKEFDEISKKISTLILEKGDNAEISKMVKEQDEIIKKMSDEEFDEIFKRNLPGPYKAKIKKLRE